MRRRPGSEELEKDGRGLRVLRLQFLDEVPEMVNPRKEILECDASRVVGWKRSDWAMVVWQYQNSEWLRLYIIGIY